MLEELGITVQAYTHSIGDITIGEGASLSDIMKSPLYMPDLAASEKAELLLENSMKNQDSTGGVIECVVKGMPAGVGEPVFDKLDASLAKAIMSIGAVKGFEIGIGMQAAKMSGSENNDAFYYDEEKKFCKETNHAGGILGGISDGSDIILRAAVKPTPSIFKTQKTINKQGENIDVQIKGRHDPIIVPRAVVVVETMTALTLVDLLLTSMTVRMDDIKKFFRI